MSYVFSLLFQLISTITIKNFLFTSMFIQFLDSCYEKTILSIFGFLKNVCAKYNLKYCTVIIICI